MWPMKKLTKFKLSNVLSPEIDMFFRKLANIYRNARVGEKKHTRFLGIMCGLNLMRSARSFKTEKNNIVALGVLSS